MNNDWKNIVFLLVVIAVVLLVNLAPVIIWQSGEPLAYVQVVLVFASLTDIGMATSFLSARCNPRKVNQVVYTVLSWLTFILGLVGFAIALIAF